MNPSRKITGWDLAGKIGKYFSYTGRKLVFTNGCFDILHPGHIDLLYRARRLGDGLMLGLNSDDSVKRLKGEGRPVMSHTDRALMLASHEAIDYVVIFDEDTPEKLIAHVRPMIVVKGGDYTPETVVGREIVEGYGGRVEIVPILEGYSTSSIVDKIKKMD